MISHCTSKLTLIAFTTAFFFLKSTAQELSPQPISSFNHVLHVFENPYLRDQFSQFLENILKQVPTDAFYTLVDTFIQNEKPQSDLEFYRHLLARSNAIKYKFPLYARIQALQSQKKVLSAQAQEILGAKKIVGYVEIGTPGTYISAMKSFLDFQGPRYALIEKKSPTDYLQAFAFRPMHSFLAYDHFVPLNGYNPIAHNDIPSAIVDLVICFIGLHHIPIQKLDNFIASIHRILRPGGVFLLRDHNCNDDDTLSLTYAAHTIYNAVATGESIQSEQQEYRNFQKLEFWIKQCEHHGFQVGLERLLQGDPTCNTMLKFTKCAQSDQERLLEISHSLKTSSDYHLDLIQTRLTNAEWFNVDISQEYGNFINHTPFYNFPWLTSVATYWKIFGKSWKLATTERGVVHTLMSSYTLMSLFIGVTMTIEYAVKAAISWPIRALYNEDPAPIQVIVHDPQNQLETLDDNIIVKQWDTKTHFKVATFPRYKLFFDVITKLEKSSITLLEIAGNKTMQVKIRYNKNNDFNFNDVAGCKHEYSWDIPTQPSYTYSALTVEVSQLKNIVKNLKEHAIEVLFFHDF